MGSASCGSSKAQKYEIFGLRLSPVQYSVQTDMRCHIRRGRGPGYELAVSFLGVGDHAATIRDISGGSGEGSTVTSLVTLSLCRSSQSIASLNCLTTCLSNTLPIVCLDTLSNLTILKFILMYSTGVNFCGIDRCFTILDSLHPFKRRHATPRTLNRHSIVLTEHPGRGGIFAAAGRDTT